MSENGFSSLFGILDNSRSSFCSAIRSWCVLRELHFSHPFFEILADGEFAIWCNQKQFVMIYKIKQTSTRENLLLFQVSMLRRSKLRSVQILDHLNKRTLPTCCFWVQSICCCLNGAALGHALWIFPHEVEVRPFTIIHIALNIAAQFRPPRRYEFHHMQLYMHEFQELFR